MIKKLEKRQAEVEIVDRNLWSIQAHNQEFFMSWEFSWNEGGTSINIHLQDKTEKPHREKISCFFFLETLKKCVLNEKFTHRWPQSGHFFHKLGHFFPIFEKGQGRPPSPTPPPLVSSRYLILFLLYSVDTAPLMFNFIFLSKLKKEKLAGYLVFPKNF